MRLQYGPRGGCVSATDVAIKSHRILRYPFSLLGTGYTYTFVPSLRASWSSYTSVFLRQMGQQPA